MTRTELLNAIKRDRAALDALVARVETPRMTEPALDDGWSVKDALAHITAWERLCLKWIRENKRDEGPFDDASINAFNRRLFDERRDLPLATVLEESTRSSSEVLAAVEALSDEQLAAKPAWAPHSQLSQIVSANSDEHYREHIDQIARWLAADAG